MNKKILIVGLLVCLLLIGGCYTQYSHPYYFKDQGNKIDNIKECMKLGEGYCSTHRCKFRLTILECDEGQCYCD